MSFRHSKGYIFIITGILAAVLLSLLLILPITTLVVTSIVISFVAIALFCFGMLQMMSNTQAYPWFAAFPRTIARYMVAQFVLSAVFVLIELTAQWTIDMRWYAFMHIVLFALFAIVLVTMHGGKSVIEKRGAAVKEKVAALGFMRTDAESLRRKFPEHEASLTKVVDALRYSDPMSHSSLAVYEEQIQRSLVEMNDGQDIERRCNDLLLQIADRNSRAKILK